MWVFKISKPLQVKHLLQHLMLFNPFYNTSTKYEYSIQIYKSVGGIYILTF